TKSRQDPQWLALLAGRPLSLGVIRPTKRERRDCVSNGTRARRPRTFANMAAPSRKRERGFPTPCRRRVLTLTIPSAKSGLSRSVSREVAASWSSLIPTVTTIQSGSSVHGERHHTRGRSMRKGSRSRAESLRSEYKRSDFGTLVRGKY